VRGTGTIFMLHRFADVNRGNAGHDPVVLRARLAALRRARRELVSAGEIARRAKEDDFRGTAPLAFTVDDGYADFATVAAPIFAEFDCPVMVFLVTGVLDSGGWYWWDRISAAFEKTARRELTVTLGPQILRLTWTSDVARGRAEIALMEALKTVPDPERHRVLDALPTQLEVELPRRASAKYAPMTWDEVHASAATGATFGAHTVTHPILSRVSDDAANWEIAASWDRLRDATTATTDVFCYPNGASSDYGARETGIVAALGFGSAVTTTPGHVTPATVAAGPDAAFRLPRFGYDDDAIGFAQVTTGVERAKLALRRAVGR
jgi:peptidoglycan/xylan/chitin deacetylase (PgdA/CDA1 family)